MTVEAVYQGAPASFSEEAARVLCGPAKELQGCRTFDELFDALACGHARFGVVPIENAIVGPLPFLDGRTAHAERELRLRVSHALVSVPGARLAEIRNVLAHPVAAAQCRLWLYGRRLRVQDAWDGAAAVADVVESGVRETAVIAPKGAAVRYGGVVLATELEDHHDNWTRFALIRDAR